MQNNIKQIYPGLITRKNEGDNRELIKKDISLRNSKTMEADGFPRN